ncbi:MAG: hypothetical protein ACREAU_00960 [Nitrosopumilaceae archaeon]
MKANANVIEFLERVADTALMVGIESILIEKQLIRGMDEAKTVAILQQVNDIQLPFSAMGLTRASLFLSRLEIAKTRDNVTIDMELDKENVKIITFKSTGLKMDYRCGAPATVQAPRQINDTMKYTINLNGEAVLLVQKAASAMGSDLVSIVYNDKGVHFQITDITGDVFSYTLAKHADALAHQGTDFSFNYPIKLLLTLFKQVPDSKIAIGAKGMLRVSVNGIDIYVLPRI